MLSHPGQSQDFWKVGDLFALGNKTPPYLFLFFLRHFSNLIVMSLLNNWHREKNVKKQERD